MHETLIIAVTKTSRHRLTKTSLVDYRVGGRVAESASLPGADAESTRTAPHVSAAVQTKNDVCLCTESVILQARRKTDFDVPLELHNVAHWGFLLNIFFKIYD